MAGRSSSTKHQTIANVQVSQSVGAVARTAEDLHFPDKDVAQQHPAIDAAVPLLCVGRNGKADT